MVTSSPLIKTLVLYFAINLVLYAGGLRVSDLTTGRGLFDDLITSSNSSEDITSSNVQYGIGEIGGETPNVNQQTGGFSSVLSFIDVVRAIASFVNFLIVLMGGIFILFLLFPPAIQLFVGVPMAFMFIIGLVWFVRSGQ